MKQLSLIISIILIFIALNCNNKTAKTPPINANYELRKHRLEAKTLAKFSAIGEQFTPQYLTHESVFFY